MQWLELYVRFPTCRHYLNEYGCNEKIWCLEVKSQLKQLELNNWLTPNWQLCWCFYCVVCQHCDHVWRPDHSSHCHWVHSTTSLPGSLRSLILLFVVVVTAEQCALFLVSDSRRNGSCSPAITSPVVDEERMMWPGHGVSALCFLQWFDTVGWVTGRVSRL